MIMIIVMLLFCGLIEHVSSIECYTCSETGFFCSLPLNLDGGDESNENGVETYNYDSDFACQSDHYLEPRTGLEKIILRGIQDCQELDIGNHRIHCCYKNYCNKHLPRMTILTLADLIPLDTKSYSSNQCHISSSSIKLIALAVIFSYIY